jgi:hypothetical protein
VEGCLEPDHEAAEQNRMRSLQSWLPNAGREARATDHVTGPYVCAASVQEGLSVNERVGW